MEQKNKERKEFLVNEVLEEAGTLEYLRSEEVMA
jgi:hypothetical protein|tara:strand:- start:119 stop:220 length:102 start_codon:yes stop_codon:yes gene_type:complete